MHKSAKNEFCQGLAVCKHIDDLKANTHGLKMCFWCTVYKVGYFLV